MDRSQVKLHSADRCRICRDFRWAVRRGEVTCIHAWEKVLGGRRCELCLNYDPVVINKIGT